MADSENSEKRVLYLAQIVPAVIVGCVSTLALTYAWRTTHFLLGGMHGPHVFDDAFYYQQVARNIVTGRGVTFDGINQTNGFQPLWLLFLLPIHACCASREVTLHIVVTLQAVLTILGVYFFWNGLRRGIGTFSALSMITLFLQDRFLSHLLSGLETPLLFVCLSYLFHMWVSLPDAATTSCNTVASRFRCSLCLGMVLGCMLLSRLDAIFIVVPMLVAMQRTRLKCLDLKVVFCCITLLITPYLVWNIAVFHHFVPISGYVKSTFPHSLLLSRIIGGNSPLDPYCLPVLCASLAWLLSRRFPLLNRYAGFSVLVGVVIIVMLRFTLGIGYWVVIAALIAAIDGLDAPSITRPRVYEFVGVLSTGGIALVLYELSFSGWDIMHWHYSWIYLILLPIFIFMVGSQLGIDLRARLAPSDGRLPTGRRNIRGWLQLVGLALLTLVTALWFLKTWRDYSTEERANGGSERFNEVCYRAALWCRQTLPQDAILAMSDCGIFGYYSERSVINLDGVINGFEYQNALDSGRPAEWLDAKGVRYLAFHAAQLTPEYESGRSPYVYALTNRKRGSIQQAFLLYRFDELYRSDLYNQGRLVIWRIQPGRDWVLGRYRRIDNSL